MKELDKDPTVAEKSLTNWKNPPSLADLKQDFMDSKSSHDVQVTKIGEYLDNLNGTGKAKVKVPKGNSSIVPLLIRKQAEWRYASLSEPFLSTDEMFKVKPVTWEDRKGAQQNQIVLNNQFNTHIDKVKFIDEYVRTAVDEGTVIIQTGWEFEEIEEEVEEPIVEFYEDPAAAELHQELAAKKEESPSEFISDVPDELKQAHELTMESGIPIMPQVVGSQMVMKPRTIKNHPTVTIRNTKNVYIDPTCEGDIKAAKFVLYTFESSLSDLRKDKKYKNLDRINIETNTILGTPDHEVPGEVRDFNFKDKPRQKFVVHEYWGYWDIDGSGLVKPIVVTWVGDTIIRMEENPFPDQELPFVLVHYLPVRKANYGEPDGALLEDNQRVVGAVTRGMIDILGKSANGQTGIRKDMLDLTNRRKYDAGLDYEFNPQVDPRMGVFMHTYPEIPQSAQFMLQMQNLEAESMTGVKNFSAGISSQAFGDVATGIRGAMDAASKRELGILRRLSAGVCEIGRKIIAMNGQFLEEEEVVRMTNDEFVLVKRDDLSGNYDLKLTISTPEEDSNKAEQLAFMLQTLGPDEDPMIRRMILSDICRLRRMPDLAKKIENYEPPPPDPMLQRIQELEVQKLESEIAKNMGMAEQHQATAVLNQAKVGTEEVKQGNIQSDTDQKNLDFVEQESGVKQERDLQKQGEQARAQTEMKLTQHNLELEKEQLKQEGGLLKEYLKARNSNNKSK